MRGGSLMTITALIDKLTDIERSIGVESNSTIRSRIIDAQDYALEMQREIGEILRGRPQTDFCPSLKSPLPRSGWRNTLASIKLTIF
jgi:hypothetical protein